MDLGPTQATTWSCWDCSVNRILAQYYKVTIVLEYLKSSHGEAVWESGLCDMQRAEADPGSQARCTLYKYLERGPEVHRGMCAGVNWINEKLWFTRGQMCSKPIIIMITLSIKYFIMIQYSYKTDNGFSWSIQQLESEKNVWAFQGLLWSDIVAWQYNCLLYSWNI